MDLLDLIQRLPEDLLPIVIESEDFPKSVLERLRTKILRQAACLRIGRNKLMTRKEALYILTTQEIPFKFDLLNIITWDEEEQFIISGDRSLRFRVKIQGDIIFITWASYYDGSSYCDSRGNPFARYYIPTMRFESDLVIDYDKYEDGIGTTFIDVLKRFYPD